MTMVQIGLGLSTIQLRSSHLLIAIAIAVSSSAGLSNEVVSIDQNSIVTSRSLGQQALAENTRKRKGNKRKQKQPSQTDENSIEKGAEGDKSAAPTETDKAPPAAVGKSVHGIQEGQDKPYNWHAAFTSQLSSIQNKTGEAEAGVGVYNLHLLAARIFAGSFEVGPRLDWQETTIKRESGDPSTTRSYDLGVLLGYNFGNLNTRLLVPFVQLGFSVSTETSKSGTVESKTSGSNLILGGGLHYFIDSNVALTAEMAYQTGSKKAADATEATKVTKIDFLNLGFSLFL